MNVVTTLKMDLAQPEQTQQVFCVQGDTFSRTVVLELLSGGKVWQIPENTSVLISYHKPDGTCGTYTQMPDGTQAWEISENVITLGLTPQMLTAAGLVIAQLKLICREQTISTFTFQIIVRPGIAPGDDPETYNNWLTAYLPQTSGADLGQYLQVSQVDASGRVTGLTGTNIVMPPDHTNRILALEGRTLDLENTASAIPMLGSRVTALERSTGEIQNIKNRIGTLENQTVDFPQLKSRVGELENTVGDLIRLESRVEELENDAENLTQLESQVEDLKNEVGNLAQLDSKVEELENGVGSALQLESRVVSLEGNAGNFTRLEGRVEELEKDIGNTLQLESRVASLESNTGNFARLEGRVEELEKDADNISGRVEELENSVEAVTGVEDRLQNLENNADITAALEGRVQELEEGAEAVTQLDQRITALESGPSSYPSELESALDECIGFVNSHQDYGGSTSVSFAYFSDNHNRGGCAGALISHVMEECGIPFSFYCGDIVSQEILNDIESVDSQIRSFNAMMAPIPKGRDLRALGEDDICRTDSNGYVWGLENNQIYHRYFRKQYCGSQCVVGGNSTYFYVDDTIHKIRFIVLNSQHFTPQYNTNYTWVPPTSYGFGQDQIDWLVDKALVFPGEGWSIVFIAHSPLSNQDDCNLRDAAILQGILSAFLENRTYNGRFSGRDGVRVEVDFQAAITADIIGWFSGHTHNDSHTVLELSSNPDSYSLPLNVVTIAADGEKGHTIDFVTVDKEMRAVFITRLGEGDNRSYTY